MNTQPGRPLERAVRIADRLYWVGERLADDSFQCHTYLLENGDDSVLFDPGSALTFPHTLRAIAEIIPFARIRYFVCHHPDPDIIGSLGVVDSMVARPDAVLVTHWRAAALLKHLGLRLPFWQVEQHDWRLELSGGRTLEFIFTPYLHFPGAFATFDPATGTLLSSDLFGGFTEGPGLWAEDESYLEGVRSFHEHYMPSREHLLSALVAFEKLPIRQIAPQHGRLIPEPFVRGAIDELKGLDCGLFRFSRKESDVARLMDLAAVLRASLDALVLQRDFRDVAATLLEQARRLLPVAALEFYSGDVATLVKLHSVATGFRGEPTPVPEWLVGVLGADQVAWRARQGDRPASVEEPFGHAVALPLFGADGVARAVALLRLERVAELSDDEASILAQLARPLAVALERESSQHRVEDERDQMYERSIRDSLTGLYSRRYLDDAGRHLFERHQRDPAACFGVVMIDVDHFKRINDAHGHPVGDVVLKEIASRIGSVTRGGDVVVRYGGEELAAFVYAARADELGRYAERVRRAIASPPIPTSAGPIVVTVSAGAALHVAGEPIDALVRRADEALYEAKRTGRDRVCMAP